MLYRFKSQLEDFFVSEVLPFELSGDGDFLYILFEKQGINTMDIVLEWCKKLKIQRFDLGIAGLKDKNGITQQWLSISKKTLGKIGGEDIFCQLLEKNVKILKKTYHTEILKVGMNAGNNFKIKLRARKNITPEIIHTIKKTLNTVKYNGFPNYFGMQRFGKGFRNVKRANKFLYEDTIQNEQHVKFNLQAFASFHFNQFVAQRIKDDNIFLEGSLVMNGNNSKSEVGYITGDEIQLFDYKKCKKEYSDRDIFYPDFLTEKIPYQENRIPAGLILGKNMLLPPNSSDAFQVEREFLKSLKFFELDAFDKFQLYAFRRPLLVFPQNMKFEFDTENNIILEFSLPTGSYATVLLGTVFKNIDKVTYEGNSFHIPG